MDKDQLQALADAASDAPWVIRGPMRGGESTGRIYAPDCIVVSDRPVAAMSISTKKHKENAAFIAAARSAIPELLAENARLEAKVAELHVEVRARNTALDATQNSAAKQYAEIARLRAVLTQYERLGDRG